MRPSQPTSNIHVTVQWADQTVFAGEDVKCKITFRNKTAPAKTATALPNSTTPTLTHNRNRFSGTLSSPAALTHSRFGNAQSPRPGAPTRGHRSTLSLNVASSARIPQTDGPLRRDETTQGDGKGHSHRRSISIISMGQSESNGDTAGSPQLPESSWRPARGHTRAASLQIIPRRGHGNGLGPPSAFVQNRSTTQPSPLFQNHSSSDMALRPSNPSSSVGTPKLTASTPDLPATRAMRRKPSRSPSHQDCRSPASTFRFPATPPMESLPQLGPEESNGSLQAANGEPKSRRLSPRPQNGLSALSARVLSPEFNNGETSRSSMDLYSISNNSTETLASEYAPMSNAPFLARSGHARRSSGLPATPTNKGVETLMMGYAQVQGSFSLDGSLVDQAPFEEVKRKGVVGGQGGGVIGVEKKRESGFLRSFGWGQIGESLGGLLGGSELSSLKDMRELASSKTIPLLSTPQSLLFVDLKLAPGESKTFEYSFQLPRGLPPTHRGKAMKISYQLVLGTQRPGGLKEQQIRSVDIPFRILGSVNEHGELLGHDLRSPYILLRDEARVQSISDTPDPSKRHRRMATKGKLPDTLDDFQSYVSELLRDPGKNSTSSLLSPGVHAASRRLSSIAEPTTAKEAIDMAILRSNVANNLQQSANRFEIARNGQRIAVIMLARPSYRLGETISVGIDFSDVAIPCYAVHATLESSEKVDSSFALRSDASIHRVTRKIHASQSESALFAKRLVFSPTIPTNATPTFITSVISLDWTIHVEFVTPRLHNTRQSADDGGLLEEIDNDERGVVLAAAEVLECESFEIAIPICVYGASTSSSNKDEYQDLAL